MKKLTLLSMYLILLITIITSCGDGGHSIKVVDLIPVSSGDEFQYIDSEGKIVINPQFKTATIFRDNLALVQTSGEHPNWGYIDKEGKYKINAQYIEATVFNDGVAWVISKNEAPKAIDTEGEILFTKENAEKVKLFSEDLAAFSMLDDEGVEKWGFVDKSGKTIINPQFSNTLNFSDGLCAVSNSDGDWGYINKEGKISVNYQFQNAANFTNDKAIVTNDSKYGVISRDGKYLVNPQFDMAQIDNNLILIEQSGKWGWADLDGKIVINPQFEIAFPFYSNEITAVKSGENYGYINKEGKFEINPQFKYAFPFVGDMAMVGSSSKIGFIDKEGKYKINPQFNDVSKDLISFLQDPTSSRYMSVETDYFNIDEIVSSIDFQKPVDFNLNSTFNDVIDKYEGESEGMLKKGRSAHKILNGIKISPDAEYSFTLFGYPYDKVMGSWNYNYVFNGDNRITGFQYEINFKNKGLGKEKDVMKALKEKLSHYEELEENKFKKENITVTLEEGYGVLSVKIIVEDEKSES